MNLVELTGRTKNTLVQKVLDYHKAKPEKLRWPMLLSTKLDGVYSLALKVHDTVTIHSRTGEQYTSMKHIEDLMNPLIPNYNIVIFEAYEPGIVQSVISGHCRDTKSQHPEIQAHCHQFLRYDEFIHGGTTTAQESYDNLLYLFGDTDINVIPQRLVYSIEEAMTITESIWANGGEGSVLRNPHAVFQGGKRNADMLRIKQGVSYDLEVVGVFPGKGKYTGMLGGILCRYKDGEVIRVGTGFSDAQRNGCWNTDDERIVGHIVQIDAMRGSSKGKLREPRFKGIRYDTEADF